MLHKEESDGPHFFVPISLTNSKRTFYIPASMYYQNMVFAHFAIPFSIRG